MKNTLLALMLVSSLFVISCGADATKPGDAYKNQPTETVTGTKTANNVTVNLADATSGVYNTINIENLVKTPGEKVTEIVQVVTGLGTATTNTNAVTATFKNADGGIYQFTIDSTTATTATVTYKYSKREAAPMVVKEAKGTYDRIGSPLTIYDANFNDENKRFDKRIVSILDQFGLEITAKYNYDNVANTITFTTTTGLTEGAVYTVKYSYTDVESMTDTPLTGPVTVTDAGVGGGNATVTIQLTDIAAYAGRSYYLKAVITDTSIPTPETIYYNGIITSTGIIDITTLIPSTITPSKTTTTGTYEIWVY